MFLGASAVVVGAQVRSAAQGAALQRPTRAAAAPLPRSPYYGKLSTIRVVERLAHTI